MEALQRRSTLAIKLEMTTLTGTAASSGTAITGTSTLFATETVVGDVIGTFTEGFRRIVSITDATHCAVNAAFDSALSGATLLKQAYAVDPTIVAADRIEVIDFTLEPSRSEIKRSIIKNTFSKLESMMGIETVAGDIPIEMHGSGTPATLPDADALWLSAIGERRVSTTGATCSTGSTTTSVVLATGGGAKFHIGDAILLDPTATAGTAYEVAWITNIVSETLTVSPALSAAPASTTPVGCGVHYYLSTNQLKSFRAEYWRGDIVKEIYKGCMVASLTLDFAVGAPINPKFSIKAKETSAPVSEACPLSAGSFDAGNVHVGRYMAIRVGGTTYALKSCSVTIANELAESQALTSSGILKLLFTERTISGSFTLLYENKAIEDAFRAGTTYELILVSSTGGTTLVAGNTWAIRLPKIKYTKAGKTVDAGVYNYDVTFEAAMTLGEDELTTISLL